MKRQVLCHVFGRRTKATLRRLLSLLKETSIHYFMTDAWPSYQAVLEPEKHIIGKRWTQRIERYRFKSTHSFKTFKQKDPLLF